VELPQWAPWGGGGEESPLPPHPPLPGVTTPLCTKTNIAGTETLPGTSLRASWGL